MRQFVFQQRRSRDGKVVKSRTWSGEYMLDGDAKPTRISLGTTDKRIAEKKLAEIVRNAERERANLVLPHGLVAAAAKPVEEHIEDYLRDLEATGRAKEYTRQVRARLARLRRELGWFILKDMTPDSFIDWRDALKASPKTKNHFHDAVRGFVNWLVDHRRIEVNLFENLKRAQIPKGSRGNHRSLTVHEVRRLIAVAPERAPIYLLAVTTGLRHTELRRLKWQDLRLDAPSPHIYFPGDAAKNKTASVMVLTEEAAALLLDMRPSPDAAGPVFSSGVPSHHTFNADLQAAEIPKHDHLGRSASFHTLRRTLVTALHRAGVDRRTAMAINRHAHSHLTDVVYTDEEALPKAEAISRLPKFLLDSDHERTEMRTEATDAAGRHASSGVASGDHAESSQTLEKQRHRRMKTGSDATSQNPFRNGAGGNRTPVPR